MTKSDKMGNSLQQWRLAIGGFTFAGCKRVRTKRQKRTAAMLSAPLLRQMVTLLLLTTVARLQSKDWTAQTVTHGSNSPVKEQLVSSKSDPIQSWQTLQVAQKPYIPQKKVAEKITEKGTPTNGTVRMASEAHAKQECLSKSQLNAKCRLCNDIETNPGPCCNAKELFNQIENTSKREKDTFQSKVKPTTMTDKLIPVDSKGKKYGKKGLVTVSVQ